MKYKDKIFHNNYAASKQISSAKYYTDWLLSTTYIYYINYPLSSKYISILILSFFPMQTRGDLYSQSCLLY